MRKLVDIRRYRHTAMIEPISLTLQHYNTIQYNARFVGRRYTNRPRAPYNSKKQVGMNDQTEEF